MPRTLTDRIPSRDRESSHVLDDYIGHWLRRAHHFSSANLSKYIGKHDLTPPQLATLLRLRECGRVSQNELGRLVAMEPGNVHKIVGRLLKRGFVLREKDQTDARKTIIHLSRRGRALVEEVEPLHWRATEDTLSVLTPAGRKRLASLLRQICRVDASGL